MERIKDIETWLKGLKKSRDFDALYDYAFLLACELIHSDNVLHRLDAALREEFGDKKALEIYAAAARKAYETPDEFDAAERAFYAEG